MFFLLSFGHLQGQDAIYLSIFCFVSIGAPDKGTNHGVAKPNGGHLQWSHKVPRRPQHHVLGESR